MNFESIQEVIDEIKLLGHSIEVISNVRSGKEATVYRVLLDSDMAAMKVYKNPEERSFKNVSPYLLGKYLKKSSHRRAITKSNKFGKKLKHENWIKREFFILEKLYELGANIPKPFFQIENAILMEFIGDIENAAPRLCDIELTKKKAESAFKKIIKTMLILWDHGIVHADLSEYNVLWWNHEPYIIDFPQSIDKRNHPNAMEILERDLRNVTKYFKQYFEINEIIIREKFN